MSAGRNQYHRQSDHNTAIAIQDMNRRLHNIIRVGTVSEIDAKKGRCRVNVGGNKTGWLKWHAGRSGDDSHWNPPSPGEQVTLLSPSGRLEQATVVTGLFDKKQDSPDNDVNHRHLKMKDGTEHYHDVDKSVRQMKMPDKGSNTSWVGSDAAISHDKNGHTIKANSKAIVVITKDEIHLHHEGAGITIAKGVVTIKGQFRMPQPQIVGGQDTPPTDNTPSNQIPTSGATSGTSESGDVGGAGSDTTSA